MSEVAFQDPERSAVLCYPVSDVTVTITRQVSKGSLQIWKETAFKKGNSKFIKPLKRFTHILYPQDYPHSKAGPKAVHPAIHSLSQLSSVHRHR